MYLYFLYCLRIRYKMIFYKKITVIILSFIVCINCFPHSFFLFENFANVATKSEVVKDILIDDSNDTLNSSIKIGDYVRFGRYYDIDDEETVKKVPIVWKVLDIEDGYCLLLSKDILKTMPYNYSWSPTNWKESNIRLWLNYDFYESAFDKKEQELIKQVFTENVGNYAFNLCQDYKTSDRLFLLSIEEVKKYNSYDNNYITLGTKYAIKEGLWISKYLSSVGYSVWWLRSPGRSTSYAAIMHADGSIGLGGDGVATTGNGVRPSVWVKLD